MADGYLQAFLLLAGIGQQTWTNMPVALTPVHGDAQRRTLVDLTVIRDVRLIAVVATGGAAGAELRLQYSLDDATWVYFDAPTTAPKVSIAGAAGIRDSGWVPVPAEAQTAATYLRVVGIGGDGAADPLLGFIAAYGRFALATNT